MASTEVSQSRTINDISMELGSVLTGGTERIEFAGGVTASHAGGAIRVQSEAHGVDHTYEGNRVAAQTVAALVRGA